MIPGMRGMNPKKLQQMMKQMGIDVEELDNVQKIIIELSDKDLVFEDATVTVMTAGDKKTYQISGEPIERAKIVDDDINLVVEQAGVSDDEARKALQASGGDLAEAIMKLQTKSGEQH
ncbi:MAG: nascent polypeptide-associated complex protein, partial [Euryarchaeota archaeon]|nr:nascent polypeptide-associated complex protein [Euryarchaeota archaeon]